MVKISIKKEKKTIKAKPKQKQKQKQKQSQKVIVNIGKDVVKPKRRRAPRKGPEKSRAMTTPNIIIPQAMPQNSMGEIIRYIKESFIPYVMKSKKIDCKKYVTYDIYHGECDLVCDDVLLEFCFIYGGT